MAIRFNAASAKLHFGILFCSALIISSVIFFADKACAQETDNELVIMSPSQQQHRLLRALTLAYQEETGQSVRMWSPGRRGKTWDAATDQTLDGANGTDMMLTSKLDWEYRADEEDRAKMEYAPLARQRVNRGDSLVGAVEYGVVYPSDADSSEVEAFLGFATEGSGRELLLEPDPYHVIPLDASVPDFDPAPYHERKPWEGEKPMHWHGVCHVGARRLHTTQVAEMKKAWMQGYNFVQGGTFMEEGILEFAEEHGIGMMGFPPANNPDELPEDEAERFKQGVLRAREVPVTRGLYAENEDHLPRIWRPTYRAKLGIDDNPELLDDVESNLRNWLRDKHGDLETLNDRWETSYDSWEDVGLPDLPLDWVQEVVEETGFEVRQPGWADTMDRVWLVKLFRDPLRYHAYAKYPRMLDTYRFYREVWGRKYRALKEGHGPDAEMWGEDDYTNHAKDLKLGPREGEEVPGFIYTTKSRPDVFLFREVPEFNAMSYDHPACKMPPTFSQMPVDIQQTAQGKPIWNSEHHLYNHDKSSAAS
ncbi:MAG: hypothetical protein ACOC0A_01615, partial [Planctomycetota bacterium]